MSLKNFITYFIRWAGLASLADHTRFHVKKIVNYSNNYRYKKTHPNVKLPPDHYLYETYTLKYQHYIDDGLQTAKEILVLVNKFSEANSAGNRVLDWGCGPARVIRHFPLLAENKLIAFGTDYNSEYISWNNANINNVTFTTNQLDPPAGFEDEYFAVIYGLSILTHLSAQKHITWIREMHRLLQPGGLLILTVQGNAFKNKLTRAEQIKFENGELVTRIQNKEGSRTFSAYQPEVYMKKLLKDFEFVCLQKGSESNTLHGSQDTWIVRKL